MGRRKAYTYVEINGKRVRADLAERNDYRIRLGLGVRGPRRLRATNYYPVTRKSSWPGSRTITAARWHCRTTVEWRRKWSRQAWERVEAPDGRVVWFWHEQRARKNVLHVMRQTTVTGGQAMPAAQGCKGHRGRDTVSSADQ